MIHRLLLTLIFTSVLSAHAFAASQVAVSTEKSSLVLKRIARNILR